MAQQAKRKAVRPARKPSGQSKSGAKPTKAPARKKATRLQQAERERDQLKEALADANTRIAELEAAHEEVINRLDWVIDSLASLKDDDR